MLEQEQLVVDLVGRSSLDQALLERIRPRVVDPPEPSRVQGRAGPGLVRCSFAERGVHDRTIAGRALGTASGACPMTRPYWVGWTFQVAEAPEWRAYRDDVNSTPAGESMSPRPSLRVRPRSAIADSGIARVAVTELPGLPAMRDRLRPRVLLRTVRTLGRPLEPDRVIVMPLTVATASIRGGRR